MVELLCPVSRNPFDQRRQNRSSRKQPKTVEFPAKDSDRNRRAPVNHTEEDLPVPGLQIAFV